VFPRWLFCFAVFVGFVVGRSLVWAVGQPNQEQHVTTTDAAPNGDTKQHQLTKTFRQRLMAIRDRTWEDPVAFYTFVLAFLQRVLSLCLVDKVIFYFGLTKLPAFPL
jgi:hypothetical protein